MSHGSVQVRFSAVELHQPQNLLYIHGNSWVCPASVASTYRLPPPFALAPAQREALRCAKEPHRIQTIVVKPTAMLATSWDLQHMQRQHVRVSSCKQGWLLPCHLSKSWWFEACIFVSIYMHSTNGKGNWSSTNGLWYFLAGMYIESY